MSRLQLIVVAVAIVACNGGGKQGRGPNTPPPPGGEGGSTGGGPGGGPPPGGSGGSVTTGGSGGVSTGGSGGGSTADAGADKPATAGDSSAPSDTPPPATGKCNATPGANAAMLTLAFKPLAITGGSVDMAGPGKSPTGMTEIRFVPGTQNEIFVSQKAARINHLRIEGNNAVLIRRYTVPAVFAEEDCGLISIAFDPDYQTNKYLYAAYCTTANRSKVTRFTVNGDALADPADIIEFSEPQSSSAFHSIGSVGFDRDKNMWLLHGEFYRAANAQNLSSTMGKLLRFIPSRAAGMGGAMPAPGNPFIGMAGKSPLIYAYGFRSPWRGLADSKGRYLVGDVGPSTAEEVNLVTMPGQNFGWDGTRAGPCNNCMGLTNPIATYRIANDPYEGSGNPVWEARPRRSVWVGTQYEDCGNDRYGGAMTGVYVFGDLFAGWVRGAVIDDSGKKTVDRSLASMAALSSWTQGPDGYLYAVKFGSYGDHLMDTIGIFRVERAP
jgi:glucose/arabinose dehydrogenase